MPVLRDITPSLPDEGLPSVLRNWIVVIWMVIQELFIFRRAEPFKQSTGWTWCFGVRRVENLQLHWTVLEVSGRVPVQVVVITNPLCLVLQFPVSQVGGKDLFHFPFILVIDSDWW